MRKITLTSIISYYLAILVMLGAFVLSDWGQLAFPRLSAETIVFLSLMLLFMLLIPLVRHKPPLLFATGFLYQASFFLLTLTFLFRLAQFERMPYRLLGIDPASVFSNMIAGFAVLLIYSLPVAILFLMHRKTYIPLIITGLLLWGLGNADIDQTWLGMEDDVSILPEKLLKYTDTFWKKESDPMLNITRAVKWVHDNIKFIPSDPLLPIDELIEEGEGTCGIQSKILHDIIKIRGFPTRIVMLHSEDWEVSHSAVEVYVRRKWVYLDPSFNLIFYKGDIPLNSWQLSKSPEVSAPHPYGSKLFENILLYTSGEYLLVTAKNYRWFYNEK
ncbi:MAG: transglutaminase domain-containing protein [Elusimicrobia bacterium]|nr:transglutaminase domain-containing protein [Elusimicrobiota bacterium]